MQRRASASALAYQIFGTIAPDDYVAALTPLRKLLGATPDLTLAVIACKTDALPRHAGLPSDANAIRDALCAGPLISFGEPVVYQID
jgi:hypothetical protein